eukprot:CAMPEP_0177503388 /NCGR_PEP_ID=MMETSP0369-20130122/38280_1 /TAXON_ID=447022 ORGANISM="Scrippsiella hangoei-like, Strain SHHI-4" /NCGR_SAMPLE_ID=MMETSP0369 /ASSEMBLY_ACC=CAM_ASM_000364 /LENGTH=175 /DNA_ID=CAMNT_0018981055 /DNA_START=189 /DNA_END=716 /DNA_ORIENTATION=+
MAGQSTILAGNLKWPSASIKPINCCNTAVNQVCLVKGLLVPLEMTHCPHRQTRRNVRVDCIACKLPLLGMGQLIGDIVDRRAETEPERICVERDRLVLQVLASAHHPLMLKGPNQRPCHQGSQSLPHPASFPAVVLRDACQPSHGSDSHVIFKAATTSASEAKSLGCIPDSAATL